MDLLAAQCKKKLETFRIKELKDVLSRIGAAKQGKKQALIDKIMAVILLQESQQLNPMVAGLKLENWSSRHTLNREKVAKVIDEIYRVRQFGAPDLATNIGNARHGSCNQPQLCELEDVKKHVESTRCPCGNSVGSNNMIQCEDPSCLVWQHVYCVIVPEKEGMKPQIPTHFFCEICRVKHGDPFCLSVSHPLLPTKTTASFLYAAEGGIMQNLEATFMLNRFERERLKIPGCDLQVWCVLLGDEVAFRMHWPLKADLRVNGDSVRVTNRPGQQKLGLNGRDDGPVITDYVREGINRISFSAYDARSFCLGVRVIQRLTVDQVFSSIPSEEQGESFDLALSRVRRCVVGCPATDDDSDSDIEIVSESVTVNLRCPMSGSRMKMAGRFKPCMHMGCFDLRTFVELNQRARKWQCPICLKNYTLNDLIIDPVFNRIAQALKGYGEDVTEIEMKPDGYWRPKLEGDLNPEFWRSPDGVITSTNKLTGCPEILSAVKVEEGLSNEMVSFKMGLKRSRDETWNVSGVAMDAGNEIIDNNIIYRQEAIQNCALSQNSTATGSIEDSSVNQDPAEPPVELRRNEVEVSSMPAELSETGLSNALVSSDPDQPKFLDIIILSDTEEDNLNEYNMESRTIFMPDVNVNGSSAFDGGFGIQPASGAIPSTEFGNFLRNTSMPLDFCSTSKGNSYHSGAFWPIETHNFSFEFFSPLPAVPITRQNYHMPHVGSAQLHESLYVASNEQTGVHNIMPYDECNLETQNFMGVDCQTQYGEDTERPASSDSSLRIFLPQQPARYADKPAIREPLVVPDDSLQEWFSLSLGGNGSLCDVAPPHKLSHQRVPLDPVIGSDPVLLDFGNHVTRTDEDICIQSTINQTTMSL